ncbi:MAG: PH domain-containing protein [Phocaeicola sp.]
MSYIQENLQVGEEIKYKADLHWYIFIYPAVILFSATLLLLGSLFRSIFSDICYYVGLFLLFLGLFQLIKRALMKVGNEYVITNKRVILKTGIISQDALELILNRCEGVRVTQSLLGRILGFGSIFVTTGGVMNDFHYIANPIKFRNEINAQIK